MNGPRKTYDVIYGRRYWAGGKGGQEGMDWMRVGRAFETQGGVDVLLYVMPPADDKGEIRILVREPRERDERGARGPQQRAPQQYRARPREAPSEDPHPADQGEPGSDDLPF